MMGFHRFRSFSVTPLVLVAAFSFPITVAAESSGTTEEDVETLLTDSPLAGFVCPFSA